MEKKSIEILWVRATESKIGQTESLVVIHLRCGVEEPFLTQEGKLNVLENSTLEGDSPVCKIDLAFRGFQSTVCWKSGGNLGDINLQT